jgi:hypothetical protein
MKIWIAVLLMLTALAYTGLFLSLTNPPFTDAPNHLARVAIMNSLWFDAHSPFQGMFSAKQFFMPYMLPDLGFMVLLRKLGIARAYPAWAMLCMLSLAMSLWFYASQLLEKSWALAAAMFCSWYFATNYLFILGFFSFQWGMAAAFVALGALESWRRGRKGTFWWISSYMAACLVCYSAHLACFAILAVIVGATGLIHVYRKEQSTTRLACELLPFAILSAYHFALVQEHPENGGASAGSTIRDKFGHVLDAMFMHQNFVVDWMILALFVAIVAGAIWYGLRRKADIRRHWEIALVAGLGAALYFVLPANLGPIAYVDQRALPFLYIPLFMLALRIFEDAQPGRGAITILVAACVVLAAANFGSMTRFLIDQDREVTAYRQAIDTIPEAQVVLPVDARPRDGYTWPLRHAGSFYSADRNGYTPYLFSQKDGSGPSGYFLDLSTIYRPGQDWYLHKETPDWAKLIETYDYVIISKPWLRERLDLSHLDVQYENDAATVFRVKR